MTRLHYESVRAVEHALAEVLQEADIAFADRAETLVAIAEQYRVSITDALLPWIYRRIDGKEWSGVEWRRWCERYSAASAELLRLHLDGEGR